MKPEKLHIIYNPDGHFHSVGIDGDGKQFMTFVTGAFPKGQKYYSGDDWPTKKRWYAVLHRFEPDGSHLESRLYNGGTTADGQDLACERATDKMHEMFYTLSPGTFCDIDIKCFSYEEDGYEFGLIYENSETGYVSVILEPNDIMFHEPWDGEYST